MKKYLQQLFEKKDYLRKESSIGLFNEYDIWSYIQEYSSGFVENRINKVLMNNAIILTRSNFGRCLVLPLNVDTYKDISSQMFFIDENRLMNKVGRLDQDMSRRLSRIVDDLCF